MSQYSGQSTSRRVIPGDLFLVAAVGLWTLASPLAPVGAPAVRFGVGLVAILFAPGYALSGALFPGKQTGFTAVVRDRYSPDRNRTGHVTAIERIVLSIGLSVCIVPLIGLGLASTPQGIVSSTFVSAVGATTVLLAAVASFRRRSLHPRERFDPRPIGFLIDAWDELRSTRSESTLALVLVIGLVLAAAGIGVAATTTPRGSEFTEFSLETRDAQTGSFVAGNYSRAVSGDSQSPLYVTITNQEGDHVNYTIVSKAQRFSGTEGEELVSESRIATETVTVPAGETQRFTHDVTREFTGHQRLVYLLYVGEPPQRPTIDNSYRHVHVWVGEDSST